jgi:hypothetical protein
MIALENCIRRERTITIRLQPMGFLVSSPDFDMIEVEYVSFDECHAIPCDGREARESNA